MSLLLLKTTTGPDVEQIDLALLMTPSVQLSMMMYDYYYMVGVAPQTSKIDGGSIKRVKMDIKSIEMMSMEKPTKESTQEFGLCDDLHFVLDIDQIAAGANDTTEQTEMRVGIFVKDGVLLFAC